MKIEFDEATHTYHIDGVLVPSVTQALKHIKPPFESQEIAERVSRRTGRAVRHILDDWKETSDIALKKGKELHAFIEATIKGGHPVALLPEQTAWRAWWRQASKHLEPVLCEHILGDSELGIAGTVVSN